VLGLRCSRGEGWEGAAARQARIQGSCWAAPGSSPLPTARRQEEPIPACMTWQRGARHGYGCRSHRHLCCLYPEVAGQQEQLPVAATLPLSDFAYSSWMNLCPASAPVPRKQEAKDIPDSHVLVLIRGSSGEGREPGREGDGERQKSASSKMVCTNGLAYK